VDVVGEIRISGGIGSIERNGGNAVDVKEIRLLGRKVMGGEHTRMACYQ
jgi:hypothetical protein